MPRGGAGLVITGNLMLRKVALTEFLVVGVCYCVG
jgi:hypothetical protein